MKSRLFESISAVLGDSNSVSSWFVPGRIEVLGKHTDYAGGRSLLCAAERGICMGAKPRSDSLIRIVDVVREKSETIQLSRGLKTSSGWMVYPRTVARRLVRNFPGPLIGADIAFASDLPPASGMSSSSALVTALFTALAAVNDLGKKEAYASAIKTKLDLAEYLGCIENGQSFGTLSGDKGVGTFGGSEDHTAILESKPGVLRQFSFCPIRTEDQCKLPVGYRFVIAVSGVSAPKTGKAKDHYNRLALLARAIVQLCCKKFSTDFISLAAVLREHSAAEVRQLITDSTMPEFSSADLLRRFEQFVLESEEVIPLAVNALHRGDVAQFGELVLRSQVGAEDGL
ncbi:MAG TPA: galactokinase family protein, partial [Terriglobales bacterium]